MNNSLLPQQINHLINLADRIILGSCCSRIDLFNLRIEWDSFIQMFGKIMRNSIEYHKKLIAINKIIHEPLPPLHKKRSLWATMFEDESNEEQRYIKLRITQIRDELMSLRLLCANRVGSQFESSIRFHFGKL